MYNVTVNGNSNVIINDIKLYVSSAIHPNGLNIDKKTHDSSEDLKKLVKAGFLNVTQVGKETKKVSKETTEEVTIVQTGGAFVKEGRTVGIPEGVIVAHGEVEVEVDTNKTATEEQVQEVITEKTEEVVAKPVDSVKTVVKNDNTKKTNKKNKK